MSDQQSTGRMSDAIMLAARIDAEIEALRIVIDRLELCKSFLAPPTAERSTPAEHGANVFADFLSGLRFVKCSCGWAGQPVRQSDHEAMAEWAAHVHVAMGLADES